MKVKAKAVPSVTRSKHGRHMVDLRQVTSLIRSNKPDRGNLQWFLKQIADLGKILQYWNYSLQIPSGHANWSMRSAMLIDERSYS